MREVASDDPDLLVSLYSDAGCIGTMRGRVSLGIDTPVITTGICSSTEVLDAGGRRRRRLELRRRLDRGGRHAGPRLYRRSWRRCSVSSPTRSISVARTRSARLFLVMSTGRVRQQHGAGGGEVTGPRSTTTSAPPTDSQAVAGRRRRSTAAPRRTTRRSARSPSRSPSTSKVARCARSKASKRSPCSTVPARDVGRPATCDERLPLLPAPRRRAQERSSPRSASDS